jgi:sugar-specific transcriptional regulator TrmB
MIEENLRALGLTENETKVYLTLVKLGKSTASKIRQETGISNSQVYVAIDSLINKGTIMYEKKPSGKTYSALNPEVLLELLEDRKKKIEECIPLLKKISQKEIKSTETSVFEGFQGFKAALFNIVNECPNGETLYIIGFSNQAYKNEKLAAVLKDVNRISIRKKHKFKLILDNRENKFYKPRKEERISTIRFMERGFKSPAAIDIYRDTVCILMWGDTPYAFTIKNKSIADGFKIYFDFLWNMAKA